MKPEKLRPMVEAILRDFPKARDSDQWLTLKLWAVYYPDRMNEEKLEEGSSVIPRKYVFLEDIMDLPREDNVKRLRAKIQNEEGKYLPTTLEVALQRRIEESVWRNYVNYN